MHQANNNRGGTEANRQKSQSIQVLKALGILCFTQSNYGSALQSQHTTSQVSGMTTSSQGRVGVALGVSSSMMESEMNKIATEVSSMVQENAQISSHLEEQLDADQQIKQKKHHKKHHKKSKKNKANRPSNGNNIGLQEQRTVDYAGDSSTREARKRAMDQVRQELENSIQEQDENHPGGLTPAQKQKLLSAAQMAEEDHDLDDPDFAGRKEQEQEQEGSVEQPVLPGQAAAEKILSAQQFAAQRELEEQQLEQEATARAHAMLTHSSGYSQSASQLASQLSSSIEDKSYPMSRTSFTKPVSTPKPAPIQSQKTANLIAQAILHQQQKAAGISEDQIEQQQAATEEPPAIFSSSLSNAAKETRLSATQTREAAPLMTLGSQMRAQGRQNEQGFVTKDELIEGSKLSMSEQDKTASQNAVQATLAKIKGLKTGSESSFMTPTPSPFTSSFSSLAKTASTPSVKQTDTTTSFPSIIMPGPTPSPNPFPIQPIQKAQKPKQTEFDDIAPIQKTQKPKQADSEDAEPEKQDKKLSQKEEEEAEFDYMNDVEARQRKLVEKHQKAKKKEEEGADDKDDDDDKKVSVQATSQTIAPVRESIPASVMAPTYVPKSKPAPVIKPVEKMPEFPMQQIPSPFVDPPSTVVQKPEPPAQAPAQMSQNEVVRRALEKIQKEKDSKKQTVTVEPSLPTYTVKQSAAPPIDQESAVKKTLEIIKQNQDAQKQQNSLPAPFVDVEPQPAKVQEPTADVSSPDIEAQKKKVALLEKEAKLEEDAKQEEMKQASLEQQSKKEEQQKAIIQKAIDAVQSEKQSKKKPDQAAKPPTTPAPQKKVQTSQPKIAAPAPPKKQPDQKNTAAKKASDTKSGKPGAKQNDEDEVAGYKISIDSLDIDDPTIKHDQAGGNPEDREKQKLAEKMSKMSDQKKKVDTQSMKQNKNDQSSSFSIETSGLDADEEDGSGKKGGTSGAGLSGSQKQVLSSMSSKKAEEKKMKQNKKEETFDFKIEETVATPEMIKHLVGDNTPDEEEEMLKPTMAEKRAEYPKTPAPSKVEVQKKQEAPKMVKIQKIKPIEAPKPAPAPTPAPVKAAPIPQKQIMIRKIQKKQQEAKKPASIPKAQENTSKSSGPSAHLSEEKEAKDQTQDIFAKGIEAAIGELQGGQDTPQEATPEQIQKQESASLTDLLAKAASSMPIHEEPTQSTPVAKTPSSSAPQTTPAPDMRSQIQSIVASIQPALQKAIGSKNTVKIQITVTDKDLNDQQQLKNALNQAFKDDKKESFAAKKVTNDQKNKVQNVTISAQNEDHVKQIVDALNTHMGTKDNQKGHMNVTVVAAPKQQTTGIVETANKYIESQNKLNQQVESMKKQKEEEEYTAKIMSAMDLIQKQMDEEQKKQEQIKSNIISTAIKAAKEKEDAQKKAILEEQIAQQKQQEEQKKKRDDIVQRHIAMGKQQKQKEAEATGQKTVVNAKSTKSQPVQQQQLAKQAPVESLPAPFVDAAPAPAPLTDYQKAIQATLAKAKEQNSSKKYGGVLSDLASSLEGTIVDEDEKRTTPASNEGALSQNSLQSQIVKNAIANAKKAQIKQTHPLSGGLFDNISNLQATMSPTSTNSVASAGLLFDGAQLMAQKSKSTEAGTGNQQVLAKDIKLSKNSTNAASVNATKESHVQISANNSKPIIVNQTIAVNQTVVLKTNTTQKANTSSMAQVNITKDAKTNQTKPAATNTTVHSDTTKQVQSNQTALKSANATQKSQIKASVSVNKSASVSSLTQTNKTELAVKNVTASGKANVTVNATVKTSAVSDSVQKSNTTSNKTVSAAKSTKAQVNSTQKVNESKQSNKTSLPSPGAESKPVKSAVKVAKEVSANATSVPPQQKASSQQLNQVKSTSNSTLKSKDSEQLPSVMPITHQQLQEENEALKKQEKMLQKQIEAAKKEKEKKQMLAKPVVKNVTKDTAVKKTANKTALIQKESAQVANKTSVKLQLKSANKFDSKPVAAAKIEQIKKVEDKKQVNQTLAVKPEPHKTENVTLIQKVEAKVSKSNKTAAVNATEAKPQVQKQNSTEVEHTTDSRPSSNTFTHLNSSSEASIDLVIEMPTSSDSQNRQSLASVSEKEKSSEKGGAASSVQAQVLNIASAAESKGSSLNQNNGVVQSVQSLVAKDLKLLDQEKKDETKSQEQKKHEEKKPAETHPINPENESWFSASLNKFRSFKRHMLNAFSLLPQQAGEQLPDESPEDFSNLQITNQQKLSMYESQQGTEQELTNQQKLEITDGFLNDETANY